MATCLSFNLIFAATAEEEISGTGGVESILPDIGEVAFGIVGEPTEMEMATAEKGLMVLDKLNISFGSRHDNYSLVLNCDFG